MLILQRHNSSLKKKVTQKLCVYFFARIRQNCTKSLVYFALNILCRHFFLGVLVNFLCLAPSFYFIGVSNVKRPLAGAFFSFVSTT